MPSNDPEYMRKYQQQRRAAKQEPSSLSPDMVEAERLRVLRDKKKADLDIPVVVREAPVAVAPKIQPPVKAAEFDPHQGHPVGFAHDEPPVWKRTSKDTWSLNDGSWTWDGKQWVGGGARLGLRLGYPVPAAGRRALAEHHGEISPANDNRFGRPLTPGASTRAN